MITKQDIIKLKKVFATKDDLKRFADAFSVVYVTKLEFNEKFDDFKTEIKDAFMTSQDRVLGEIKAMREEMAAYSFRQRVHSDQLEDHETRIIGLESKN